MIILSNLPHQTNSILFFFFFLPNQSSGTPTPSNSTQKRLHSHAQIHRPIPSLPLSNPPVQHPPPLLLPNGVQPNQRQLPGALHRDLGSPRSAEIRRSKAFYEDPDDRSFEVAAESDVGLSDSRPVYQPERPREGFVGVAGFLGTHGIFPSSFTFCSLIHSFSNEGDMSKAIEVLELMTDEKVKYPFDNFVSSSVISGFCKIWKPEIAVKFLENAVDSGALEPNIVTYAALVAALCKLGRVNEVCDLVCRIEKQGLALDVVLFSSWICGYILDAVLMEVFDKNKQMVDKGIRSDTISHTITIYGFSKLGDVEKALGFVIKMRKGGLEPNLITYTAIMSGFCKKGKMEEAFAIFKTVEDLGIEVDEFMYATLIHRSCIIGDLDGFFDLLHEMLKRGLIQALSHTIL